MKSFNVEDESFFAFEFFKFAALVLARIECFCLYQSQAIHGLLYRYIRCGRVVTDFDWEAKNRFNF